MLAVVDNFKVDNKTTGAKNNYRIYSQNNHIKKKRNKKKTGNYIKKFD